MSIPIDSNLAESMHLLLPKLLPNFYIFKLDAAGRYVKLDIKTGWDLKLMKYQGTLVVSNDIPLHAILPPSQVCNYLKNGFI